MAIVLTYSATTSASTALDIIKRARRLIGALAVGETLESDLANDGLMALNAMMDSWSIDNLAAYGTDNKTYTLSSNVQNYTIGTGGAFNGVRPDRIESAIVSVAGSDYSVEILDDKDWNNIVYKTVGGTYPQYLRYSNDTPLGTISLYPIPNGGTITLTYYQALQRFTNLTDLLVLPSGYERALASNLALEIAPEAGAKVSQELVMMARQAKANILRINLKAPLLRVDSSYMSGNGLGVLQLGLNG